MILALDLGTSTGICWGAGESRPSVSSLKMPATSKDYGAFFDHFREWYLPALERMVAAAEAENAQIRARNKAATDVHGPNVEQEDELEVLVIYEAPILPDAVKEFDPISRKMIRKGGTNIETTRRLQGLAAIVEVEVSKMKRLGRPVIIFECANSSAKKALGGTGRADKGDMVFAARRAGIDLSPGKEGQDEADAFGVWLVGLAWYAPHLHERWDAAIRSNRGSLV